MAIGDNMDILSLAIIGTAVSIIISLIKKYSGTSGDTAKLLTIVVSLIGGGIYYALKDTSLWQSFLMMLGYVNAIYLVLIQHFDNSIEKLVRPE